jgi:hypothetical protein
MPIVIEPAGSPAPLRLALSRQEWDLLWTVRAVAPGALKDSLMRLLMAVAEFVREPGCAEAQADGVPCDSASSDCEQCRRVTARLERLSVSLRG